VFAVVPQAALAAAVAQVDSLTRPLDDPYFDELMAQHRRIRRFLPYFARGIGLGAMPAGRPVLEALEHLRKVEDGGARGATWPTTFVPKSWERRVTGNGGVDRRAWTLCLIDRLRAALRRRDVFAMPSLRFADPRIGLLDGAAWEAAKPTVCRTLGKSQNAAEEISRLTGRLDQAFQTVAGNLPRNASVRIEPNGADDDLVLTGLTVSKNQTASSLCGAPWRRACRASIYRTCCWRSMPEPDSPAHSPMPVRRMPAPATWRPACAPCCWPRRATPAWNRWCAPTRQRFDGRA
jgi:hypothetical protein